MRTETIEVIKRYNAERGLTEYLVEGICYVTTQQDTTKLVDHPSDAGAAQLLAYHFPNAARLEVKSAKAAKR